MAITHKVSFTASAKDAITEIQKYEDRIVGTAQTVDKYANSLGGGKVLAQAHNWVAAVDKIGGATKLTATEQARVNTALDAAIQKYAALGQQAPAAMTKLYEETKRTETSTTAMSTAVGVVAAEMIMRAGRATMELGKDALLTSARVESLGGVAAFMGQQAGYTKGEIDALASALQKQGITTGQSYDTIIQMVRANMSLADSTKLATVAQGLARATGENSSATLAKLIQGTQTLQVEVLRNAGVVIQLDQEYKKFAASSGRTTESLGAQEKQQIALAAVLREGEKVLGVYGVTNEFVGGKIQSMKRHSEEASLAIGDVFAPALGVGTDAATALLKLIKEYPDVFGAAGLGAAGLATAFTGLKASAALGAISAGTLTTALGLLWPAVAVGATAFSSWKLGGWIGEVTRLTDGVEMLAGRMMGLSFADIEASMSARKFAESAEGKTKAVNDQAKALEDLGVKARQTALDSAKRAADEAAASIATAKAIKEAAENADSLQRHITSLVREGEQWDAQVVSMTKTTHALAVAWGKDLVGAATKAKDAINASIVGQLNALTAYQQKNELALLSGTDLKLRQLEIEEAAELSKYERSGRLTDLLRAEIAKNFELQREAVTGGADHVIAQIQRETVAVQQAALTWSQAMDAVRRGEGTMIASIQNAPKSAESRARTQEAWENNNYWGPVVNNSPSNPRGTGPDWEKLGYPVSSSSASSTVNVTVNGSVLSTQNDLARAVGAAVRSALGASGMRFPGA